MRVQEDENFEDFFQTPGATPQIDDPPKLPEPAGPVPPRLGLLANLNTNEFDVVARSARLNFLPKNQIVFQQGDEADRFFILVDGQVHIERDGEVIATLGAGSFFGESALLVRGKRSATVWTLQDSSLWSVSYEAFEAAVSGHLMNDRQSASEIRERLKGTPPNSFR
jgi:CRP-like cAMP-binding protein